MKLAEKRVKEIPLDSIIDNEFFTFCKEQAMKHPGDWEGIIVFTGKGNESAAMPDTQLWEMFNADRRRVIDLARSEVPAEEALKILDKPENLQFVQYALTRNHKEDWKGLVYDGEVNKIITTQLQIELQKTYWNNRRKPQKETNWYQIGKIALATTALNVSAMVGLYFWAESRVEKKIDEKSNQVERRVEDKLQGIENRINTEVEGFKQAQQQNNLEMYIPRIRVEVEDVLRDYEKRAYNPDQIVNGVVRYLKENPEVLRQLSNDEQFRNEIRGIIFEAMRPR